MFKITFFLLTGGGVLIASDILPGDQALPGWTRSDKTKTFTSSNLYGHINGGAELFLEFGFTDLVIQPYIKTEQKIEVEVYRMADPSAALGIFLMKTGGTMANAELPVPNAGNRYQLSIACNEFFIQINNFSGNTENISVMQIMAGEMIKNMGAINHPKPESSLPDGTFIPRTLRLFRGPYALQSLYTFGTGDVFLLDRRICGVAADYTVDDENNMTLLVIDYADPTAALRAFQNVSAKLDPYLKVVTVSESRLIFLDYQNKYGIIQVEDTHIMARVHLPVKP